MRRWRSPLVTLTMFASLWTLGSAVAPIVDQPPELSSPVVEPLTTTAPDPVVWKDPEPVADPTPAEKLACLQEPCPEPTANRPPWHQLVSRYFKPEHVDRALRVIRCESGGNSSAANPTSSASGLFQHLPQYWSSRAEAAGFAGASIFDAEANIAAAAWLVYHGGGWSHWSASSSCWR